MCNDCFVMMLFFLFGGLIVLIIIKTNFIKLNNKRLKGVRLTTYNFNFKIVSKLFHEQKNYIVITLGDLLSIILENKN